MGCSLTKKVINIKQNQSTDSQNDVYDRMKNITNNQRTLFNEKKCQISRQTSIIFIEQVPQNKILDNIMKNLKNKAIKREIPMESPTTKSPVQGILKYKTGSPCNSKNQSFKKVNFTIEKQDSIDEGQFSIYEQKKKQYQQYET